MGRLTWGVILPKLLNTPGCQLASFQWGGSPAFISWIEKAVNWICHQQKSLDLSLQHYQSSKLSSTQIKKIWNQFLFRILLLKYLTPQEIKSWTSLSEQVSADSLTYAPSWKLPGCNAYYTVDKFRQVLQDQWMVKSPLDRHLGLGKDAWVVWKCLQRKDRKQETPFSLFSKCVRLTVVPSEGSWIWHCLIIRRHLLW